MSPLPSQIRFAGGTASGGALLFHPLSKLYDQNSVVITTNQSFNAWATVHGDARRTTALLDRLIHCCHILETGNDGIRFKVSSDTEARKEKETSHPLTSAGAKIQNPRWLTPQWKARFSSSWRTTARHLKSA